MSQRIQKSTPATPAPTATQALVRLTDHCPLCDTQLIVRHVRTTEEAIVEKAHCPQCHVPARDRTFSVH